MESNWHQRCWRTADLCEQKIDCDALDALLENAPQVFKHDRTTTVASWSVSGQTFILKRYNARNQWHKLKRAFRRSRARRCWLMSYQFERAGLKVAKPALMYEQRQGPWRGMAYFANTQLAGEELLSALPKMSELQRDKVARAVFEAFACMREHKISHGDMKASNLLWLDEQLYFIDLDGASKHRLRLSWIRSNRRDKRRFLKNWQHDARLQKLFKAL